MLYPLTREKGKHLGEIGDFFNFVVTTVLS